MLSKRLVLEIFPLDACTAAILKQNKVIFDCNRFFCNGKIDVLTQVLSEVCFKRSNITNRAERSGST